MGKSKSTKGRVSAAAQIRRLRNSVRELQETLAAIRHGLVDAVVVSGSDGERVFTLQGAEHPYRVLVETMNEGAATFDVDGTILYANSSFARILGVPLDGLISTPIYKHFSPEEREQLASLVASALQNETTGELTLLGRNERRHLVRFSLSPVRESEVRTICVIATDLTEISIANQALKASEDVLRNLSGRVLRLQDEERRRISRDLHDVTGQKLALLSMDLSAILSSKGAPKDGKVRGLVSEAMALSNEVNQEIRTLSYLLHPPLLDELGLSSAVHWFTQGFETRTGIRVAVDIPASFVRLAPDAEVALFRVVQESLSNVHRYSGSATAYVRARAEGGKVILEIGDFGKGMSEDAILAVRPQDVTLGVGIQGMKERLRQLSGSLQIASQPDKGMLVTAILPIGDYRAAVVDDFQMGEGQAATSDSVSETGVWRKRILIADDHDVLRRGIRTMLETEPGLEVCGEAVDGKDALEKTLAQAPDLLILDINMPVLNGVEVVRQIVRYHLKTKILAFSVHDSKQIVDEIIAAGAHSYLSKATAGQNLVKEVNSLLNNKTQAQPV